MRVIALTSVQPNEGKSTMSSGLAVSFAKTGYRTLLIDADTRNSVMSGTFRARERVQGLTSYLSGNADQQGLICDTTVENLYVIPAGQVPPNPTALLQGERFKQLIESARSLFDYIIIDTPPIGLVIDAAVVAQDVDGMVLVAAEGIARRRFVTKAVSQLEQAGTKLLGVILNRSSEKSNGYGEYGAYGSYGEYGSYGKNAKTKKSKKAKKSKEVDTASDGARRRRRSK